MTSRKATSRSRSTASKSEAPRSTPTPLDVAARLLTRAPRTEAELEARLVARGYQPATAARTVARCRELGYVGDERLAHERARALRARGAGALKIAADLAARGLSEELIDAAVVASRDEESEVVWARRALARAGVPRGAKAWQYLAGRGFSDDVIEETVDRDSEP
jgi:regulatory protein